MNRPTTQTAPNLQTTAFTYGKGSLLDRVSIDGTAYLTNIAYNARGQRTDVWFAVSIRPSTSCLSIKLKRAEALFNLFRIFIR